MPAETPWGHVTYLHLAADGVLTMKAMSGPTPAGTTTCTCVRSAVGSNWAYTTEPVRIDVSKKP